MRVQTDLEIIGKHAVERNVENEQFRQQLTGIEERVLDAMAHAVNDEVSSLVDCTACGNCCRTLVINVERDDVPGCARGVGLTEAAFEDKYIEESAAGHLFVSTVPCHFLTDNKCTVYEHRFTDCREFPHLHKPGFRERLGNTLMYYGMCPIIYNVVEEMKFRLIS